MKVQWIELSEEKRKALHIILKEQEDGIEGICTALNISRGSIFNKLNSICKFKEKEYKEILTTIGMTDEEIEECSKSYILKFLHKKGV